MVGAEFVHGDLVIFRVADQPLVGVEAVIARTQVLHNLVDVPAVLYCHARAECHRCPFWMLNGV